MIKKYISSVASYFKLSNDLFGQIPDTYRTMMSQKSIIFRMLNQERGKASFDKKELSYIIYDSPKGLEDFLKVQKAVSQDEVLRFNPKYIHSPRKENMLIHAKKLIRFHEMFQFDYKMKGKQILFFSEQMPLSLHFFMFLITLNNLCTEKQVKLFFEPAVRGEIIGCYAQTELSHGSDIQNLATTATYDEDRESFIIHSNGIGATKWWIGDLGVYANHAIIFAQLIIKGKKYGLHAFLVPIRDKNHEPFSGVEVGDIGPKYGYNCKDNGYVRFENYAIPRRNMLMKYAKVNKDGEYQRRGNQKISYATMLIIRSIIPMGCFMGFSKACTIAVRYSLYRTQFKDPQNPHKQLKILDYQVQQNKVLCRVAELYAIMFGSYSIRDISRQVFNDAKDKNQFSRLNEVHSLTSGIKAIFTNDTLKGLEVLRRAMGGHGYSSYSAFPGLISELSPTPTYEGQNTILFLQTARFLLKAMKNISKGKKLPPTVQYLHEMYRDEPFVLDTENVIDVLDPEAIRKVLMYHSCESVKKAAAKLTNGISEGTNPKEVWDTQAGLALTEASTAHTYFWIYENFFMRIYNSTNNEKLRKSLRNLLLLYGIDKIIDRANHYFESGTITSATLKTFHKAKEAILALVRPDALALVQAFEYSDNTLHSAIGCADENPYDKLMDWAKNKNVVNEEPIKKQLFEEWKKSKSLMKPKI